MSSHSTKKTPAPELGSVDLASVVTDVKPQAQWTSMEARYVASMALAGVGDALGYWDGKWEFMKDGVALQKLVKETYGDSLATLSPDGHMVSDDTVMTLATARSILKVPPPAEPSTAAVSVQDSIGIATTLTPHMASEYIVCANDMNGRAPGVTCMAAISKLAKAPVKVDKGRLVVPVEFSGAGGGCGGAMRAMPLGLRYPGAHQLNALVATAVESGRLTHNHPTGFLGAVAAALFTAYAVRKRPVVTWGRGLMEEGIPAAKAYLKEEGRWAKDYAGRFAYFEDHWRKYLSARGIDGASTGNEEVKWPTNYGAAEREAWYKEISWNGWGGASGHDAVLIAYDAFLGAKGDWVDFCWRGIIHGGDNDTTATIGGAWFGALHGFTSVPPAHVKGLEYLPELVRSGMFLSNLAHRDGLQ